jgi:hypothetical protein
MPYTLWNNSTIGFDQMVNYLAAAMEANTPGLGGSFIGIAMVVPLFTIVFMVLGRIHPLAAFTTASFLCWIASLFLVALQILHPVAFGLLFGMWVFGALAYYMQSRD